MNLHTGVCTSQDHPVHLSEILRASRGANQAQGEKSWAPAGDACPPLCSLGAGSTRAAQGPPSTHAWAQTPHRCAGLPEGPSLLPPIRKQNTPSSTSFSVLGAGNAVNTRLQPS